MSRDNPFPFAPSCTVGHLWDGPIEAACTASSYANKEKRLQWTQSHKNEVGNGFGDTWMDKCTMQLKSHQRSVAGNRDSASRISQGIIAIIVHFNINFVLYVLSAAGQSILQKSMSGQASASEDAWAYAFWRGYWMLQFSSISWTEHCYHFFVRCTLKATDLCKTVTLSIPPWAQRIPTGMSSKNTCGARSSQRPRKSLLIASKSSSKQKIIIPKCTRYIYQAPEKGHTTNHWTTRRHYRLLVVCLLMSSAI